MTQVSNPTIAITLINATYCPLGHISLICRDEKFTDIQKIFIDILESKQSVQIDIKTKSIELRINCDLIDIIRAPIEGKKLILKKKGKVYPMRSKPFFLDLHICQKALKLSN